MNIITVLIILFIHWVADFLCQTDWQAKNKSTNNNALFMHVASYTAVWIFPMMYFLGIYLGFWFIIITFAAHFVTDYFTSRLNAKLYKEGKIYWFFVSVEFDQFLHYVQLLLTFYFLLKW
jgi:hypothetical protein